MKKRALCPLSGVHLTIKPAFSHFEADILHFAAKLSLLQQLTRPKAQNLTFISKTRPLKHRNVSELQLHKTPISAPFQCQNHPLNAKI